MNYKRNGYILILTILVISALFFISIMFLGFFNSEQRMALVTEQDQVAATAANAGIDDSIYQLKKNAGWIAGFQKVSLPHSGASYTVVFDGGSSGLPYSTNNVAGSGVVTGYGGRQVPAGAVHLVSLGEYEHGRRMQEALVTSGIGSPFESAVFVDNNINMNGNVIVDSYNSSNGSYENTHEDVDGNVGTNSSADGTVDLVGNVVINGNVGVGPDGTEENTIHAGGNATYQSFSSDPPRPLPHMSPPIGTNLGSVSAGGKQNLNLAPGTYMDFSGKAQSMIYLSGGDYVFTGDFDLGGQSQIIVSSGKVRIYVLGNISLAGGGVVNESGVPGNLLIFGGPDTHNIDIVGLGTAYVGIHAPGATIDIKGNAQIYGGLVAENLFMNGNGGVHFDKALLDLDDIGNTGMRVICRWGL